MSNKQKNNVHPKWSYSTNIYEVNLRQYTLEGTLWFMPITPISKKDRLGELGSYYAVQNYTDTNPEFGTLEDFKKLVTKAHDLGFKIILDFVADHTGNDHAWITEHPEFYNYEENKELLHPHGWIEIKF
jgi:alpha-amylase